MVFHFKQRIEKLEKKNNNLSDLTNKIVKEITNLHSVYLQNQYQQQQPRNYINPKEHICENIRITTSIPITFDDNQNTPYKKIVVMDTIANDDNNDIMTIESESEYEYDNDNDSELYSETEFLEEVDIPINGNNEETHLIKLYDFTYNDTKTEIRRHKEEEEEEEKVEVEVEEQDQIFDDLVNEERETNKEEVVDSVVDKNDITTMNYHKLTVSKLRILAISKGLCSDTSKIKRADLIKLLESETGEI
jgi:hypothetical protein